MFGEEAISCKGILREAWSMLTASDNTASDNIYRAQPRRDHREKCEYRHRTRTGMSDGHRP